MQNSTYGMIYKVINKINRNIYIGQTIQTLNTRISGHISSAMVGGSDSHFHRAIRKYGKDNFTWEVIDEADTKDELDMMEMYWIRFYNTYKGKGYNETFGGAGVNTGITQSEEVRLKRSISRCGKAFYVFDLDGVLLGERMNQKAYADEIGVCVGTVNNILLGIKSKYSAKGRIIMFKEEYTERKLDNIINKLKSIHREFVVFDKYNNYLGKWNNFTRCNEDIKIGRSSLNRQLTKNLGRDTSRRFKAYYIEDIPEYLKQTFKEVI